MRAHVLGDAALAKHAGRFVWLSIDIDKDKNAEFVRRYPVIGVPTLMVIDPATEKVALSRAASADPAQLAAFFDEGERIIRGGVEEALAAGERAMGEGRYADAAQSFRRALAKAKLDARARVVEALVTALDASGDKAGCAQLAVEETATGPRDARFANTVSFGLSCAMDADKSAAATLQERAREAIGVTSIGADDRSSLYELLVSAEPDAATKKQIAAEWIAFLEGEAARAKTSEARAAFDAHRLGAAIALGDPGRAIPALLASEKALPDDYNAAARLAIAYNELGRFDEALAAVERARKKVYGPRALRVEETAAQIYAKKGDAPAAKKILADAIQMGESLPKTPRTDKAIERLKKKLEKM